MDRVDGTSTAGVGRERASWHLTASVARSGDWWAAEVPEIPGLATQARRVEHLPEMVIDAAWLLTGLPTHVFTVVLVSSETREQRSDQGV